mmetsp:Transcript_40659/g.77602  ORF Transcript_40659/g.77602 Transcript_40659/m.77602 type:complete len:248 (-) Transcript_40659:488-1231(-)
MRSPTGTPSGGTTRSTAVCSSFDVHNTMPKDSTLRILAGLRLHSTSTRAPSMRSWGTNLTSPLTTWRGLASPRSISSTYKLSASGCLSTLTILPTRMSSMLMHTASSFLVGISRTFFSFFSAFTPASAALALPFSSLAAALASCFSAFAASLASCFSTFAASFTSRFSALASCFASLASALAADLSSLPLEAGPAAKSSGGGANAGFLNDRGLYNPEAPATMKVYSAQRVRLQRYTNSAGASFAIVG